MAEAFVKLEIYVPESHAEAVRQAVCEAGAGRLGRYDHCCWRTSGSGCFRPLAGSTPFLGETGKLERVPECKLETICRRAALPAVLAALRQSHPYETPAFQYWEVELGSAEEGACCSSPDS